MGERKHGKGNSLLCQERERERKRERRKGGGEKIDIYSDSLPLIISLAVSVGSVTDRLSLPC